MIQQLLAQATGGFSVKDLPFLFLQLSASAIIIFIVRRFFSFKDTSEDGALLVKYALPIQVVLTTLAVFSNKSPWIILFTAIVALIPMFSQQLSMNTRILYLLQIFIAAGCGAGNLVVTILASLLIIPSIMFISGKK